MPFFSQGPEVLYQLIRGGRSWRAVKQIGIKYAQFWVTNAQVGVDWRATVRSHYLLDSFYSSHHKLVGDGDANRFAADPLNRQNSPGWTTYSQIVEVISPPRMTVATG